EVGLLEIIQQLQGREMPAREWEESILPVRMLHYEKEWLDRLCLSGRVGWGRFSTPAAMRRAEKKRIRPTGTMPVTLYLRNEFGISDENQERNIEILSSKALEIYSWLKNHGASFTEDIVVS